MATLCTPALGNTQDVALRTWLHEQGLRTVEEGGTVRVKPAAPADIFGLFARGDVQGAWVPEPWASRMVIEAGGRILVDERGRWPGGVFPTTVVIASTVALERRPDLVRRFLEGHRGAVRFLEERPDQAAILVGARLLEDLKSPVPPNVLERALGNLSFTLDPMEPQLRRMAAEAEALGFLQSASIGDLVDRSYLPPAAGEAPAPPPPGPAPETR
jgi:NitT/TauT family transport system substrate-binding protein